MKLIKPFIVENNLLITSTDNVFKKSVEYVSEDIYATNKKSFDKKKKSVIVVKANDKIYNDLFAYNNISTIYDYEYITTNTKFFFVDIDNIYLCDNRIFYGKRMRILKELSFKECLKYDIYNKWLFFMYENDVNNRSKYLRGLIKKGLLK